MLRPSQGITNGSGLFRTRSRGEGFRHFDEHILGNSTAAFDHLWRVAREMAFQHLIDAARMLKRDVSLVLARILRLTASIFSMSATGRRVPRLLAFDALYGR